MNTTERIYSCLIGQAYGDSIGLATEFMSEETVIKYYGNKDICHSDIIQDYHRTAWKKGDWTDDTDMMILCMRELVENKKIIPISLAQKLYNWYYKGFPELGDTTACGIGNNCRMVICDKKFLEKPLHSSRSIWKTSHKRNASNGGIMRTSIFGCLKNIKDVIDNSIIGCMITHFSCDCKITSLFISLLIHFLIFSNDSIQQCIDKSFEISINKVTPKKVRKRLYKNVYLVNDLSFNFSKNMGSTYKPLICALWGLHQLEKNNMNFLEVIQTIIKKGGDADTNACVVGAVCSIRFMNNEIKDKIQSSLIHINFLNDEIQKFILLN